MPRVRFTLRTLMVAVAGLAPVLAFAAWISRLPPIELAPSDTQIHAMGDQLIADLEAWRAKHGRFPASLAEAKLASPTTYKGGFLYEGDATGFVLRIGVADGINVMHVYTTPGYLKFGSPAGWNCMD